MRDEPSRPCIRSPADPVAIAVADAVVTAGGGGDVDGGEGDATGEREVAAEREVAGEVEGEAEGDRGCRSFAASAATVAR